jgi:hypothetical protein
VGASWYARSFAAIFENLKTSPIEEVLENFHVTRQQVQTVLDFAAKSAHTHRWKPCASDEDYSR